MKNLATDKKTRSALLGRLLVVLFFSLAWSLVIVVRLVDLQTFKAAYYNFQAESQQTGFVDLNPKRGPILDRNLHELAISVRADSIFGHPDQVENPEDAAHRLAPILETSPVELLETFRSDRSFVYLQRRVSPATAQQIQDLAIPGVATHQEITRVYPNKELAAHLLGFVGIDNEGLGGLEYHFDDHLSGRRTRLDLKVDARRNGFARSGSARKNEGKILVLTVDQSIQHSVEEVLAETVRKSEAASGSALVMDVETGEVYAMASYPTFNPNKYGDYPPENRRNRAILDLYEPGSTFKIFTLASLIDQGLASPDEIIDCRPGTARLANKVYKEAKRSFEFLTVAEVLAKSSNIGTVKLAIRLGEDRLHDYIDRFGFGNRTGIALPGEEAGLFRPVSQWSKISIGALSIGQEIGVTPLQVIRAGAAIANGGYLVQPRILRSLLSPDGDVIEAPKPKRQRILSSDSSRILKAMMQKVVEEGTGSNAQLKGYSSAGKTGTAQKIVDGRYSHSKYVASFLGFAPVENPRLICLVVVNEPRGIPYGGYVAAPAFKEMMERALIHLNVPQDRPTEMPPALKEYVSREPIEEPVSPGTEEGEIPLRSGQLRQTVMELLRGQELSGETGALSYNLEEQVLPDFTGLSLRQVARICAELNIRLKISGAGIAINQRPAAGSRLSSGLVCEVFFSSGGKSRHAASTVALQNPRSIEGEHGRRN